LLFLSRRWIAFNDLVFNSLIALLTTFVGAYVAFALTNYQAHLEMVENAKIDLKTSMDDLANAMKNCFIAYQENKTPSDSAWSKVYNANPLDVSYYNTLLLSEGNRRVFTECTISETRKIQRDIANLSRWIGEGKTNQERYVDFIRLLMFMEYNFIELQNELRHQSNTLSKDSVEILAHQYDWEILDLMKGKKAALPLDLSKF